MLDQFFHYFDLFMKTLAGLRLIQEAGKTVNSVNFEKPVIMIKFDYINRFLDLLGIGVGVGFSNQIMNINSL